MVTVHANYCALKRAMWLPLHALFLIAPLNMLEHAAQLGKPAFFVCRHDGLLTQDTIRQVGSIGIESQQRHDKKPAAPSKKPKP